MDNIAISVEHVKKIYKLYDRNRDRLKDALGFSKKPLGKEHYALNDVSFDVCKGEILGIMVRERQLALLEQMVQENLQF